MAEQVLDLNDRQKDALREIGNIGAGNAATAFAHFLNKKVEMNVPDVEIIPQEEVAAITGNEMEIIAGILLKIKGEAPGSILFVINENSIKKLFNIIIGQQFDLDNPGEMEKSALKEIGNIMSGSYLNSINKITGLNLRQSVPAFSYDIAGAILTSGFILSLSCDDHLFLINTHFSCDGQKLQANLFLIPETGSLKIILKSLGLGQK